MLKHPGPPAFLATRGSPFITLSNQEETETKRTSISFFGYVCVCVCGVCVCVYVCICQSEQERQTDRQADSVGLISISLVYSLDAV